MTARFQKESCQAMKKGLKSRRNTELIFEVEFRNEPEHDYS
jgi:hypothetical protein